MDKEKEEKGYFKKSQQNLSYNFFFPYQVKNLSEKLNFILSPPYPFRKFILVNSKIYFGSRILCSFIDTDSLSIYQNNTYKSLEKIIKGINNDFL